MFESLKLLEVSTRCTIRFMLRMPISPGRHGSEAGSVCSRREAERWIADGRVAVNGSLERAPNRFIDPARDVVLVDGRRVSDETPRVVIALHKPVGLVTTRVDPGGRPTVYDALGALAQWVFPVGRLDRDSSGLLILTNDHRLGERLTAPAAHVPKTYHARVRGLPDAEAERGRLTRWPDPPALASRGIAPFAGDTNSLRWQQFQQGKTVNYLGIPADAAS
jgi:23S rRNA-/tRNA-specific pseudouridylate synthase